MLVLEADANIILQGIFGAECETDGHRQINSSESYLR